jgi:ABC-type dipeptide/oligopeptide/nickel transport system permease subunit
VEPLRELEPQVVDEPLPVRRRWRWLRHRNLVIGGAVFLLLLLLSFAAPIFTHVSPDSVHPLATLQKPSALHLFGTDELGRDLFSRVLYGGRYTILASLLAMSLGVVAGSLIGLAAGIAGGWVDMVLMRLMDLILAFPGILPALAITTILGPSYVNLIIAIGFSSAPGYARIVEAGTLQVKQLVYVEAAESAGSSRWHVIRRHVLPNVFSLIVVAATTGLGITVLSVAALGFLGLGVQPPTPEWGSILNEGRQNISLAWWISLFPGIFITLYVIAVSIMGDGLRDLLDPMNA